MDHKGDLLDIIHWLSKHCRFNHQKYPEKFRKPLKSLQNDANNDVQNTKGNREDEEKKGIALNPDDEKKRIQEVMKESRIRLWGPDIPTIVESFDQLSHYYEVDEQIVHNLKEQGYTKPTPIQMQVWPLMFKEREILATSATGSGKTAAFLVPILQGLKNNVNKGIKAIILAPTRELSRQTYSESLLLSENTGIEICLLHAKHKLKIDSIEKCDLLITTPISLVSLIKQEVPINLSQVSWLVIDESDRLFEDGDNGFRDQIAVIYKACDSGNVCRALFSATVASHVEKWCKMTLNNVAIVTVGAKNIPCKDVDQTLTYCGENEEDTFAKSLALNEIFLNGYEVPCIIFVSTKERAQALFKELILDKNVVAIHADIPRQARDNLIRSFRMGEIFILICTDLISRGLDFRGVNLVINYDFPYDTESYIHRIGRTGRAGHKGKAITFWCKKDIPKLKRLASIIHQSGNEVPDFILNMKKSKKKGNNRRFGKNKQNSESSNIKSEGTGKNKKTKKADKTIKNKNGNMKSKNSNTGSKNEKTKRKFNKCEEAKTKRQKTAH